MRGIHNQTRTLLGFALNRFGNDQGPISSFEVSSLSSEVPSLVRGFDIRDGFIYGCNALGMWRVRLDGVSALEKEIGPPCRSFAFANDGIWIAQGEYPFNTLTHFESWGELAQENLSRPAIQLEHEILSIDSEDEELVWATTKGAPFSVFNFEESPGPAREYDYVPTETMSSDFDAVADNQTFYVAHLDGDPGIMGISHQYGTVQLTARTDKRVQSLHCWTR